MPNNSFSPTDITAGIGLSNSNLTVTITGGSNGGVRTVSSQSSGKCYWEYTFSNISGVPDCGFANLGAALAYNPPSGAAMIDNNGAVNVNGGAPAVLAAFSNGGICCIALDLTAQRFWVKNGAAGLWNNSGTANPATGVGGIATPFVGAGVAAYGMAAGAFAVGSIIIGNFGDTAFVGAVPAGFASGFPGTAGAGAAQARAVVMA